MLLIMKILRKLGFIEEIYSDPSDPYMRVIYLTPKTYFGQLRINHFFRGDNDIDPHDHPWDFWTFPFSRCGYLEVAPTSTGMLEAVHVKGLRLARRKAEYAHIVLGRARVDRGLHYKDEGSFTTLVWTGRKRRDWGFYPYTSEVIRMNMLKSVGPLLPGAARRMFVPWRAYLKAVRP